MLAFVAAEAREFLGLLRRAERVVKLDWPIDFARMAWWNGQASLLVANGPGPKLAGRAAAVAKEHEELKGLVSTGFCGALDPAFEAGDILIATHILGGDGTETPVQWPAAAPGSAKSGKLLSMDRVAGTAAEKSALRKSAADAVEMEAAGVAARAAEYKLPFYCIRVVTDTAQESLPLDFNRMRDTEGRFNRTRIVAAAIRRPLVFPQLLDLNRKCRDAAQALGDFIADTRF